MKDKHFNSRMLTGAGTLMALSALLISCCGEIAIGGILLAASACMFFAARNFRIAEDKKAEEERTEDEGQEKE